MSLWTRTCDSGEESKSFSDRMGEFGLAYLAALKSPRKQRREEAKKQRSFHLSD